MVSSDESRLKIITTLFAYYGQAGDGDRIALYCTALNFMSVNLLNKASKRLILTSRFVPTVAEIVDAAKSIVGSLDGNKRALDFDEAWKEIIREAHRAGIYQKPQFSRPEIKETAMTFGWRELCMMPEDDISIARAQMKKIYEAVISRSATRKINLFITGNSKLQLLVDATVEALPGSVKGE